MAGVLDNNVSLCGFVVRAHDAATGELIWEDRQTGFADAVAATADLVAVGGIIGGRPNLTDVRVYDAR